MPVSMPYTCTGPDHRPGNSVRCMTVPVLLVCI